MSKWKKIIKDNHCGYGGNADYSKLVLEHPIEKPDLEYFEEVIRSSMCGGNSDYDCFPDNGGIDIAAALLEEVKRLRLLH